MKKNKIVFSAVIIASLVLLIGGILVCVSVFDYSNKVETTATITAFESYRRYHGGKWRTHHKTHLTYEVEGQTYTTVAEMYSSSWRVGEEIEIYYDIENPQSVGSRETDWVLLVIPSLGFLSFSISTTAMLISHKKAKTVRG